MKPGPLTERDKKNATTSKLKNCDVILIFFVFGQSGAIRKADSRSMVCKTFIFINSNPADTDVFNTSSGRLKKVTTSYDQTRRHCDVWKKTSKLRRLEDVWLTSSWRRPIYDVLKTSDLRRLQDVQFTTSWRRLIYVILKTSNLGRLENVWFTTSSRCLIYDVLNV